MSNGLLAAFGGAATSVLQGWEQNREQLTTEAAQKFKMKMENLRASNNLAAEDNRAENQQDNTRLSRKLESENRQANTRLSSELEGGLIDKRSAHAIELQHLKKEDKTTYGKMAKDKATGLLGQYSSDGEFHEARGGIGGSGGNKEPVNIKEYRILTAPKEEGGLGYSDKQAESFVYEQQSKPLQAKAESFAYAKLKGLMLEGDEFNKAFAQEVGYYKKNFGEKKAGGKADHKAGSNDANMSAVLSANPSWDKAKAAAYLKHIGK